jgi:hypothetical protein
MIFARTQESLHDKVLWSLHNQGFCIASGLDACMEIALFCVQHSL